MVEWSIGGVGGWARGDFFVLTNVKEDYADKIDGLFAY